MVRPGHLAWGVVLMIAAWSISAQDAQAHQWWRHYPYGGYDVVVSPQPPIYVNQPIYPRRLVVYAEENHPPRVYRPRIYYRGPLILRAR